MHSKNKRPMDETEIAYVAIVKALDCIVCGARYPSDAHEPEQGLWFLSVPLCKDCHTGPHGWHGDKSRWRAAKMTEMRAINETRRRVDLLRAGRAMPETAPSRMRKPAKKTDDGAIPRYVKRRGVT